MYNTKPNVLIIDTFLINLSVTVTFSQVDKVTYEGAQVWQTTLRGAEDVLLIKRLVDNQDISIWNLRPTRADFLVRAQHKVKVYRQMTARNLSHTVLIMDVQRRIDTQPVANALWTENTLRIGHRLSWKKYPTLNIIEEYYNFLAEDYSSICRVQSIGTTAENRTIKMINITNGNPNNQIILITGGQHAREWASVTSALYVLHNIITKFDKQKSYVRNKNWLIIPVVNPDGYVYSHTVDRLWRKNRRKFMYCVGVDVNRNFDTDWGIAGITENNECKTTYSGPYPFSEAESVALRDLIKSLVPKPIAIVDFHSYGKLILFPWSARPQATPDLQLHRQTADLMTNSMYKSTKQNYTLGATYHTVYPATGTFLDWAYSTGVAHTYVIESRDKGELGFLLPPEEIEDTGKELYAAVRALAKTIKCQDEASQNKSDNETWF
ncbi:carboxypeptidase B-like [Helicoverpa zea]|uniref:carboxypeptidase B-like n=1 Tax=Helicoverpa zea TaxID=7113 RepID=UPI001F5A8EC3|nr:carboxypeptidase B-like [Helicoverpa zea]